MSLYRHPLHYFSPRKKPRQRDEVTIPNPQKFASRSRTLGEVRSQHRVSRKICTVVVDHVIRPHPLELPELHCVQLIVSAPPSGGVEGGNAVRGWIHAVVHASVHLEVLVVSQKRSVGPVHLVESSSRGPVVPVPDAGEYVHGPHFGVEALRLRSVPQNPDGHRVDVKSASSIALTFRHYCRIAHVHGQMPQHGLRLCDVWG